MIRDVRKQGRERNAPPPTHKNTHARTSLAVTPQAACQQIQNNK
jgi:hypothetical protein